MTADSAARCGAHLCVRAGAGWLRVGWLVWCAVRAVVRYVLVTSERTRLVYLGGHL